MQLIESFIEWKPSECTILTFQFLVHGVYIEKPKNRFRKWRFSQQPKWPLL